MIYVQRKGDLTGGGLEKIIAIVIALAIIALIGVAVMNSIDAGDTKITDTGLSYEEAAICEAQCAICMDEPCKCTINEVDFACD